MARGGKRSHKGGRKQFTNPQALEEERRKEEKEKEWRRQRGIPESDSEEEDSEEEEAAGRGAAAARKPAKKDEDESSEEEDSSEEEESSEDEDGRRCGTDGLIEIENPNRVVQKQKKLSSLNSESAAGGSSKPTLSRREREEVEKQRAKAHYQKLHAAGKTEEARADLARLAIIRKQREEAAKKREEEKKAKEQSSSSKKAETAKALGKKK